MIQTRREFTRINDELRIVNYELSFFLPSSNSLSHCHITTLPYYRIITLPYYHINYILSACFHWHFFPNWAKIHFWVCKRQIFL